MVNTLKLPVGIDSFEKIRRNGFADAKRMLGTILANEMDRHYYLKTSDALTDEDKAYFAKMLTGTDENIEDSIRKLSQLLYKHHGKKAVIIIDEYDVPLDKAYQNGCLRVSKESIFTGLNNFKVLSIVDKLKQDGMRNFIKYGIACFKKDCRVVIAG